VYFAHFQSIKLKSPFTVSHLGEAPEARARRIRQYEDFFNASGMATPDDLEEFRACQAGYAGIALEWNDMCRGSKHWIMDRMMQQMKLV
jgi:benzoate/toluate 1,2-dioxygenase alpha subunit